jgi:ribosomal protein S18 acetylase RimI-like enzyme
MFGVIKMEFRSIRPEDFELVRTFLAEVGWKHRVSDPERFRRMMEKTDRTVVAWDDQRVVGFGRALCDGISNGYISMVAVATDRQGHGIGRKLVEHLMGNDHNLTWVLRSGHDSEGFWEKMGFKRSIVAMERLRDSAQS